MAELNTSLRHSLLIRTAGAMTLIALVVLAGMGGAMLIAETARGNAAAINVAGSLRMQSYRLSAMAFAAQSSDLSGIKQALDTFEQTLHRPELTNPDIAGPQSKSAALRQKIVLQWNLQIKPAYLGLQRPAAEQSGQMQELRAVLQLSNAFVTEIDALVKQIEHDTEARVGFLRYTIGATLILTLLVMMLTMYLLHRTLLTPLRDLVAFTTQIRHGDLRARTPHVGQDELGRLGHAFNLMAEDLSTLYGELEARVAEKTADLERSNRCLELLYHSIARLYGGTVEADTYKLLLREIEEVLGLGPGSVCLVDPESRDGVSVLATTLQPEQGEIAFCSVSTCAECIESGGVRMRELAGRRVISIALRDAERVHGVLQLIADRDEEVAPWKLRLLEALARHVGTAIGTVRRVEHQRVLSLMEERSVIARELHDSLAQSLSYMKIQVSRLGSALERGGDGGLAGTVLGELREGLNSAYRQLRELLTTFRLRIEEESLAAVLEKTAQEFTQRGALKVVLETQLTNCALSANEEIHILQIVREALSNVVHHAHAKQAKIAIHGEAAGPVFVRISDDGVGVGRKAASVHHYGMAIMEERARSLGGDLKIENRPEGGAMVEVRFVPAQRRALELQQKRA